MSKTWLAIAIAHTLFVCVLIPVYWNHYGPTNFLWFSDVALLASVVALWTNNRLIASTQTLSILILEIGWTIDLLGRLALGNQFFGLSAYMFDATIPLVVRMLSLFHLWLPPLLLWLVLRNGYDRRALWIQALACWALLGLSFLLSTPQQNINWVYGLGSTPQTVLPQWIYLLTLMGAIPILIYLPTHLLLCWLTGKTSRREVVR